MEMVLCINQNAAYIKRYNPRLTAAFLIFLILINMILAVHPDFPARLTPDTTALEQPNQNTEPKPSYESPYTSAALDPSMPPRSHATHPTSLPPPDSDALSLLTPAKLPAAGSVSQTENVETVMTENIIIIPRVEEPAPAEPSEDKSTDDAVSLTPEPELLTIKLYGNGGIPELNELTTESFPDPKDLPTPRKPGKMFDCWYTDESCTNVYSTELTPVGDLKLYAGWTEFPGFVSDDSGYITGYTDHSVAADGLLVLPFHEDCLGVSTGAFAGLEAEIFEVFIPANIVYLEDGAFDCLTHLFYFQADSDNPVFYSREGILYYRADNSIAAYPKGRPDV